MELSTYRLFCRQFASPNSLAFADRAGAGPRATKGPALNTGPVNIAVGGGCIPNREEASRPASIIQCAEEGSCQKSPDAENE
jgi:hypothetical protein